MGCLKVLPLLELLSLSVLLELDGILNELGPEPLPQILFVSCSYWTVCELVVFGLATFLDRSPGRVGSPPQSA